MTKQALRCISRASKDLDYISFKDLDDISFKDLDYINFKTNGWQQQNIIIIIIMSCH